MRVSQNAESPEKLTVTLRELCWLYVGKQLLKEPPVFLHLQILYGRFINHGRENRLIELQVMWQQTGQNSCTTDRWGSTCPPDVQPVLRRALPSVVIALTLG
jgi:hypothetical protein